MRAGQHVWQLGWDSARILVGLLRTIAWAIAPQQPRAGLAVLEGEATAHVGAPSLYRVRVHNPTTLEQALDVLITGWQEGTTGAAFRLRWNIILAPGEAAERWVRSSWLGDASLLDEAPPDIPPVWRITEPTGRWRVEAKTLGTGTNDVDGLCIAGSFVR